MRTLSIINNIHPIAEYTLIPVERKVIFKSNKNIQNTPSNTAIPIIGTRNISFQEKFFFSVKSVFIILLESTWGSR